LNVTVPANGRATVEIPATSRGAITESGSSLSRVSGVRFVRLDGDLAVLSVGAGSYRFASRSVPAGYVGAASAQRAVSTAAGAAPYPISGPGVVGLDHGVTVTPGRDLNRSRHGSRGAWPTVAAVSALAALAALVLGLAVRRRASRATPG